MPLFLFLETRRLDYYRLLLLKNCCRSGFVRVISYIMNLEFLLGFFRFLDLELHDCDNWCLNRSCDCSTAARARGRATRRASAFGFTKGLHYLIRCFII